MWRWSVPLAALVLITIASYGLWGFGPMPAFGDRLTNTQMADLANYVRLVFAVNGNALPRLSGEDVSRILR